MDGMWELFFATGLPQAYLAARREKPQGRSEPTLPPRNGETISSLPPSYIKGAFDHASAHQSPGSAGDSV